MAPAFTVKVLEQCHVSPPPGSAPATTTLPLTFFDIPWLLFSPSQPLFFYEFPYSTTHFTSTVSPILKHSLSLTLQHFHPLAGSLSAPPPPERPTIVYAEGDSVAFTVAESNSDFYHLSGNHPRDVGEFYSLVPQLLPQVPKDEHLVSLLAVQITVFRESGMCIGLSFHHVVADERTFNFFMKSWVSICKSLLKGQPLVSIQPQPCYDRSVIIDPNRLLTTLLHQFWNHKPNNQQWDSRQCVASSDNLVLATFVISPTDMEKLKMWIITQWKMSNQSQPLVLSAYVLTCAFVWNCLIKVQKGEKCAGEKPLYFGFLAGGISRLNFIVPTTYVGNCISFGRSIAMEKDLIGENGIVAAAKAIASTIKELDKEVLGGAEQWICEWEVLLGKGQHVMVVGSPKVNLYEMDFGWGRPNKIENISFDGKKSAISLTESRHLKGGIEVGLVLSKAKMDAFTCMYNDGLRIF